MSVRRVQREMGGPTSRDERRLFGVGNSFLAARERTKSSSTTRDARAFPKWVYSSRRRFADSPTRTTTEAQRRRAAGMVVSSKRADQKLPSSKQDRIMQSHTCPPSPLVPTPSRPRSRSPSAPARRGRRGPPRPAIVRRTAGTARGHQAPPPPPHPSHSHYRSRSPHCAPAPRGSRGRPRPGSAIRTAGTARVPSRSRSRSRCCCCCCCSPRQCCSGPESPPPRRPPRAGGPSPAARPAAWAGPASRPPRTPASPAPRPWRRRRRRRPPWPSGQTTSRGSWRRSRCGRGAGARGTRARPGAGAAGRSRACRWRTSSCCSGGASPCSPALRSAGARPWLPCGGRGRSRPGRAGQRWRARPHRRGSGCSWCRWGTRWPGGLQRREAGRGGGGVRGKGKEGEGFWR